LGRLDLLFGAPRFSIWGFSTFHLVRPDLLIGALQFFISYFSLFNLSASISLLRLLVFSIGLSQFPFCPFSVSDSGRPDIALPHANIQKSSTRFLHRVELLIYFNTIV
jgi:hypothetical protein